MTKYKCKYCPYRTNRKSDFEAHQNRKLPCYKKLHGNAKEKPDTIHCDKCDKDFSREDSLKRHNETFHATINATDNQNINGDNNRPINGDNNRPINGDHNTNGDNNNNNNNNNINSPTIIINYFGQDDINDLTLFEQYLALTSKTSPYITLLDQLNLNPNKSKYNNVRISNINRNIMDIHNGTKWLKETMKIALSNIIDTKRVMIELIFNRFRMFLSNKANHTVPRAYYYGLTENYYLHKQMMQRVRVHLYNNRDIANNNYAPIPPKRRNHEIWWALSKQFEWIEVESLLNELDELGINLDNNLGDIKIQLNEKIHNNNKLLKFFDKFLLHLDQLIDKYELTGDDEKNNYLTPESSSDDVSVSDE